MRRSFLNIAGLVLFLGIVGSAATYSLALNAPYVPGNALFPVQDMSEQLWGVGFNGDSVDRAQVQLSLLAHRLDDLAVLQGTTDELTAVHTLTRAYNRADKAIVRAPSSEQPALNARRDRLAAQALALLAGLENAEAPAVLALHDQIAGEATIELVAAATAVPSPAPTAIAAPTETAVFQGNQLDDPRFIPFPPQANILEAHSFFALTGGHANLLCSNCHTGETYNGAPTDCAACHAADDAHEGTYGSDCATCHTIDDWQNATFDHSIIGTQDCAACHTAPENHYPGACTLCHTDTNDFNVVSFDHANSAGQDCAVCHAPPANHYPGACTLCHSDTTDFRIAVFNHSIIGGQDCAACHAAPANHYSGACVNCHQDTGNFRNVNFNHAGLTNCAACHAPPANHFPGQCSACHNTTTFAGATFNHTFSIYHGNANGNCTTCHPGNDTRTYTCFNCHNQQKMIGEHSEEGIGDLSNCVRCHADGKGHEGGDRGDD
ncbi:MAG: hypothetical protein P8183_09910 [Anaerolineae bacterium]